MLCKQTELQCGRASAGDLLTSHAQVLSYYTWAASSPLVTPSLSFPSHSFSLLCFAAPSLPIASPSFAWRLPPLLFITQGEGPRVSVGHHRCAHAKRITARCLRLVTKLRHTKQNPSSNAPNRTASWKNPSHPNNSCSS